MRYLFLFLLATFSSYPLTGQNLPVMTYNIRFATDKDGENSWEKRREAMVDLLEKHSPAVLGTQEGLTHQLNYLLKELAYYKYVGVARDDGRQKGEYCAILYDTTRIKLIRHHTFWLDDAKDQDSIGWDAAMKRICTYGLFQDISSGNQFWVFNAHFDHVGREARKESANMIRGILFQLCGDQSYVVVMGDFNSEPGSDAIRAFKSMLDDGLELAEEKQEPPLGTYTAFRPEARLDRRIDYIFVQGFKVKQYQHLPDRRRDGYFISDHLPVMANLKF